MSIQLMVIFPAIDLRGQRCVRLRQGDYEQETIFDDDPAAVARKWAAAGASWLHLVDLDGARGGKPGNTAAIQSIVSTCGLKCQLGGGLRTDDDVAAALSWGVDRVVIGTRALDDPESVRRLCKKHPGHIAVGVDARDDKVAVEGWKRPTDRTGVEVAKQLAAMGVAAVVYTDISRDGMMNGPNFSTYERLVASVETCVIASGGVTTLDDVRRLAEIGVGGCIIGRALYEGRIQLSEAIRSAGDGKPSSHEVGDQQRRENHGQASR